jgi:PAS domain S-box-containing protein
LKESYAGLEEKVRQRTKELVESLEQVSRERDKTDAILHSIGDGVFVIDKDYKIVLFNPVATTLSGFSIKEALGKNYGEILKFVDEKSGIINDKFIKKAMNTGKTVEMSNNTVLIRKDDTKVPVADSAAPLKNKEGEVTGCVVVFRDVSKERDITELKDDFLNIASHDLRAPASVVKGYLSMILEGNAGKISPQVQELIQYAYEGNERAIHLINDFLNVSRIERGKIEIKPQKGDLIQITEEVIQQLSSSAKEKGLFLEHKKIDLPPVLVDKERIIEVLTNLLINAIKYTNKGSVAVSYEVGEKEVITHVTDTGIGISEKDQKQLFEKFYRVPGQSELAPAVASLGLGLYICRLIINTSNGKIWAKSTKGKGSTFSFSLPICPEK